MRLAAGGWWLAAGGSREDVTRVRWANGGSAKRRLAIQVCRMGLGRANHPTKCATSSVRKYGEIRGQAAHVKESCGTVRYSALAHLSLNLMWSMKRN